MRAVVTPVGVEKVRARRRENRRHGVPAVRPITAARPGEGSTLGYYEALLRDHGEAEVVTSVEALLRAITDRLAHSHARPDSRKR